MAEKNLFLNAAKSKYRFPSNKGALLAEQLFDLKLPDLNEVAKSISKTLKSLDGEEDFIGSSAVSAESNALAEKLEIVKYVIGYKQDNEAKAKAARDTAESNRIRKTQILEALEAKNLANISKLSEEELRAELARL